MMSLPKGWANRISGDASSWVSHLIALRSSASQGYWRNAQRTWVCSECQVRWGSNTVRSANRPFDHGAEWRKRFSTVRRLRDDNAVHQSKRVASDTNVSTAETETATSASTSSSSLPSHTERQRSATSKRMSKLMDGLLARASIASQHINAYTGTDYSGIETLRKEIQDQEEKVRVGHSALDRAKSSHHDAVAEQASAQREIVGLLERKSSWSPADLERYMSLVRSEHVNDQAVQSAKENLGVSERQLEESRSFLERLERKQYHEEQIWSDTIRRNSTWVTFVLMGVNIVLLLAQIAIFEPYRRKKIVRDVKMALDEKTVTAIVTDSGVAPVEQIVSQSVNSEETGSTVSSPIDVLLPPEQEVLQTPLAAEHMLPDGASDFVGAIPALEEESLIKEPQPSPTSWHSYHETVKDLFSDRIIEMRKVDLTSTVLSGIATGAAVVGVLVVVLRPR